ncbi:uncharacterized protein [Halyomorpha halys]|uniref:uncharacterized protein isoform X2 n=1 Tax=Halyomorpha halys TaxID=286706 RepID=UPI0006D4C7F7|nr:uncharacterized protein LOC106680350 isoform X2 [Halyomorpha halys]
MLVFFISAVLLTTLLGLVVPSLRKNIYEAVQKSHHGFSFSNELKGSKDNAGIISQQNIHGGEEFEQSINKLEVIENDINELKNQANQVKYSYRLAIIQLIETLQMLEKSLQEDHVVLSTLENQ